MEQEVGLIQGLTQEELLGINALQGEDEDGEKGGQGSKEIEVDLRGSGQGDPESQGHQTEKGQPGEPGAEEEEGQKDGEEGPRGFNCVDKGDRDKPEGGGGCHVA